MCSFRLNRKKMNKKWKRQPFGLKAFFNGEKLLERSLLVQKTRGQIHMIALRGEHRARRLYSVSNCWAMCFHSAPRIVKAALNCGRFSALTWGTKDPFDLSTAEPCPPGPKRRCPVTFSHVLNGTPPPGVRSVISNKGLVTLWWNAVLYTQIKFLSGKVEKRKNLEDSQLVDTVCLWLPAPKNMTLAAGLTFFNSPKNVTFPKTLFF